VSEILYFPYQLSNKGSVRNGSLISYRGGFADLFPWPEFGDSDLKGQLQSIQNGKPSTLAQRSLQLAEKDAIWRQNKKTPIQGSGIRNHFLITNETAAEVATGFEKVKIKMKPDFEKQISMLEEFAELGLGLRLDFNCSLDFSRFVAFEKMLPAKVKKQIEFIEDPFQYNNATWAEANQLLPLACDFEFDKVNWSQFKDKSEVPFSVLIYKPARQDRAVAETAIEKGLNITVTSSMDHPVGCLHALAETIEIKKQYGNQILDSGCMSWLVYGPNEFTENIHSVNSEIVGVNGSGIGFDKIFERLPWKKI
jgi:O-succinylbenzoate synthase